MRVKYLWWENKKLEKIKSPNSKWRWHDLLHWQTLNICRLQNEIESVSEFLFFCLLFCYYEEVNKQHLILSRCTSYWRYFASKISDIKTKRDKSTSRATRIVPLNGFYGNEKTEKKKINLFFPVIAEDWRTKWAKFIEKYLSTLFLFILHILV